MTLSSSRLAVHHILLQLSSTLQQAKWHRRTLSFRTALSLGVYTTFHCNMWEAQQHKTPCSMSATSLLIFCNCSMRRLMNCALQWQCSVAWSYLSLIQNCSITRMHALVPANTIELHRPCQPCCDTEHGNACNLLRVACLPLALPFEVLPPVPLQPYCNSTTEPDKAPDLCPITL